MSRRQLIAVGVFVLVLLGTCTGFLVVTGRTVSAPPAMAQLDTAGWTYRRIFTAPIALPLPQDWAWGGIATKWRTDLLGVGDSGATADAFQLPSGEEEFWIVPSTDPAHRPDPMRPHYAVTALDRVIYTPRRRHAWTETIDGYAVAFERSRRRHFHVVAARWRLRDGRWLEAAYVGEDSSAPTVLVTALRHLHVDTSDATLDTWCAVVGGGCAGPPSLYDKPWRDSLIMTR